MNPASFDSADLCADALCHRLFKEAEQIRWRSSDIPWHALERERVSAELLALVREITFAEMTTHSATRRFLSEFSDDVDFTQWLAVWFYEESSHPQVLMEWLHQFGEQVSAQAVRRARTSTPFMRSRFGTLVTNIISETVASNNYLTLHRNAPEPVLAVITKYLAADEARHARGFFAYARRMLERSPHPDLDRLDALKLLQLWFEGAGRVTHPVSEFGARAVQLAAVPGLPSITDTSVPARHACRLIGTLIGQHIDDISSVEQCSAELRARLEGKEVTHAAP
jgi:hypothetical protein